MNFSHKGIRICPYRYPSGYALPCKGIMFLGTLMLGGPRPGTSSCLSVRLPLTSPVHGWEDEPVEDLGHLQ